MVIIDLYKKSFEGIKLQVWYLGLMMFVNRMGTLVLPFLTLYTTQELGWSKIDSGIASACFGLGSLFGAMAGGYLVDKFGYWKIIFLAQFGAGVAFFSIQFITSFYPLCFALLISSMIADTLRPAVMTAVTFISSAEARTRAISLLRMSFNLGFAIGPALAGILIAFTSYRAIFIVDGLTCLCAAIFAFFYIERDRSRKLDLGEIKKVHEPKKSPYNDTPFMLLMLWSLIMLIAFFQTLFTVPLFMTEELNLDEKAVGLFFALNGLIIFLSEMPIVYFTERKWRLMPAIILGNLMIGIAFIFLLISASPWFILLPFVTLLSYGEIISFPFITSLSLRRVTKLNTGQYMGIVSMVFSLAIIISPIVGTNMIEHFGYDYTWILCFGLCIVSSIGYYRLDKVFRIKKKTN